MREIEISFLKEKVTAVLLDNEAPSTCDVFWKCMPFESIATHAKLAGEEIMIHSPIFAEPENEVTQQDPGNICLWTGRQITCIFYNSVPGLGPVSLFAKVTENLEGLKTAGRRIWLKQGERVSFRRKI